MIRVVALVILWSVNKFCRGERRREANPLGRSPLRGLSKFLVVAYKTRLQRSPDR